MGQSPEDSAELADFRARVEAVMRAFADETPTVLMAASVAFAKRADISLAEMKVALNAAWHAELNLESEQN